MQSAMNTNKRRRIRFRNEVTNMAFRNLHPGPAISLRFFQLPLHHSQLATEDDELRNGTCLWVRARSTKDPRIACVITVGVLLAYVTLNLVGGDWVEALVLRARVGLSKEYAKECEIAEAIPMDDGKIRVCNRRWHMGNELTALIKFDGDREKLVGGGYNKATALGQVNMFLPFGVLKYRATPVSGDSTQIRLC
jgi:hypothetical protein